MIESEWFNRKIGELVTLINGRGFKSEEWSTTGLPIIRISNLNGDKKFNYYNGDYDNQHLIQFNDLLFSWSGNRGTSFGPFIWNGMKGLLNQHIFRVIPKESIEKYFLYYSLLYITKKIEGHAHGGSGLVHITKKELEGFILEIPSPPEQHKIANILLSIDKAIEKTEAIIAQTETVKKGLMHQLFTKGIGHTRFKQTEIGEIPEEWEVIQLSEIINNLRAGVSVNSENREAQDEELGILKTSAVTYGEFNPKESKVILKSELDRVTVSPKKDHLIISRMNTPLLVGASVYIDNDYPNLFLPDRLWLAEVKRNDVWVKWLGYLLSSYKMRERISDIATGTSNSMKNISKKSFLSLNISIPSLKEQKQISDILTSIDKKITIEQQKLTSLQTLKKGLMQVLLTGKVRVKVDQPEEVVQ